MKDLFKKITHTSNRIDEIDCHIENTKRNPFYLVYGDQQEKELDMQRCYEAMKVNLDLKQVLLESLQIEINKELNRVSQAQRTCTLLKIA